MRYSLTGIHPADCFCRTPGELRGVRTFDRWQSAFRSCRFDLRVWISESRRKQSLGLLVFSIVRLKEMEAIRCGLTNRKQL